MNGPSAFSKAWVAAVIGVAIVLCASTLPGCDRLCVAHGLESADACERWCKRSACGATTRVKAWDSARMHQSYCECEAPR